MLEKLPFHTFFLSAWHASLSKKLPWIFGFFIALAGIIENKLGASIPTTPSFQEFLSVFSEMNSRTLFFFIFILIFLFSLEVFGRSNLVVSLSFITDKKNLPNYPNNVIAIKNNFFRLFTLECCALFFLLIITLVFLLPCFIASQQNPDVMDSLLSLGILTFIPIYIAVFFVKQFATFYLLLSPLKLRSSIEASGSLFSRFVFQSIFFGFFSIMLTLLFTFCVNTVILSFVALSKKIGLPFTETHLTLIIGLFSFAWFSIFQQALWLTFFKFIAKPKEKELVTEKETVLDSNTLSEIPPAQ